MPELPEVFTIVQSLNQNISGFRIEKVEVKGNFKVEPSKNEFVKKLEGRSIKKVFNVAKNIVFLLENENHLVVHLAMTGQLLFERLDSIPSKWERVSFFLNKGKKGLKLAYNDMRMFGKLKILNKREFQEFKQKYGLNPLDEETTAEAFHEGIKSKRSNIKSVLLDQKIIAGAGNIYVNDALFMARIHPKRTTNTLETWETETLLEKLREILNEGITHGGATLEDGAFVDPFGKKGKHQNFFRIYSKKACPKCKSAVTFEKISGRGTYYCKTCQK